MVALTLQYAWLKCTLHDGVLVLREQSCYRCQRYTGCVLATQRYEGAALLAGRGV